MKSTTWMFVACLARKGRFAWKAAGIIALILNCLVPFSALADGCFVFKWDKNIDINEPTQKAIIVHNAGREDMLLQVKYEGPLEEFGWLIPTPTLPKVEKGSTLMTNQLTMARLLGLKVLQKNADAKAIELSLPLLRDTNSIVRDRAFAVIRAVSGENALDGDPAKWEKWWSENKDSFTPANR